MGRGRGGGPAVREERAPKIVLHNYIREARKGERGRGRTATGCRVLKQKISVTMPLRNEVGLDRAVFAAADDLPVLPAAAQSLPLVSLGAVQRQRGADVPELYRAVLAAAQHLRA